MTTSSISSVDGSNPSSFTEAQKKTIDGTIELMKEAISTLPESERNAKSLGITALDFMNTGLFETVEEGERASAFTLKALGLSETTLNGCIIA